MTAPLTISAEDYHADMLVDGPTLSSSIASVLVSKSPAHARYAHPRLNPEWVYEEDAKYDFANAAHASLLEGKDVSYTVHKDSWRTNEAKEAREEGRRLGLVPLLAKDVERMREMLAAAHVQFADLNLDPTPFTDGRSELTLVWDEGDVKCRARLDWLRDDFAICDDFKSTSASADPARWSKTAFTIGADIQSAFYRRGLKALTGLDVELRYIVQETYAPYVLSPVTLGPDVLTLGDAKVDRAVRLWKSCLASERWPGYVDRLAYIELPPWEEARFLERETREEMAA